MTSGMKEEFMEDESTAEEADGSGSFAESLYEEEEEQEVDDNLDLFTRPIVVGYAFGPKKMSTMGVVMAEASKTKLSRTSTFVSSSRVENGIESPSNYTVAADNDDRRAMPSPGEVRGLTWAAILSNSNCNNNTSCTAPANHLQRHIYPNMDASESSLYSLEPVSSAPKSVTAHVSSLTSAAPSRSSNHQRDTVVFTMDNGIISRSCATSGGASDGGVGLRNIVRYFRSSCSSVADSLSTGTGTCTASVSSTTGSQRTASTARPTTMSSSGSTSRRSSLYPVRVSFVPLDMEIPLEEQHSGQMDIVLHKLTEDILCLSQLSMLYPELKNLSQFSSTAQIEERILQHQHSSGPSSSLGESELAALRRVHRLCQFQANHPECSLVDDPVCVQTLMSRSDIATTLERCLQGVASASGMAVSSPKSTALRNVSSSFNSTPLSSPPQQHTEHQTQIMMEEIRNAGLAFPIIVKPLIAAGTKASHSMAVLLEPNPSTLARITTPCLCQEYSNHDSLLYKVYVLGEHVSVHKRRSLPNLPRGRKSRTDFVEFDSQKTYPRLSDFGFDEAPPATKENTNDSLSRGYHPDMDSSSSSSSSISKLGQTAAGSTAKRKRPPMNNNLNKDVSIPTVAVTAEEVQPIVNALKGAFGLELFGFDVLITSTSSESGSPPPPPRMLVVDVNYFPSYKELNFPALLAQYLTDKGIERRRMAHPSL